MIVSVQQLSLIINKVVFYLSHWF